MEHLFSFILFLKVLVLFMAITCIIQNCFKLYKSMMTKSLFEQSKTQLIVLWVSVSYILTMIFI